MATRSTSPERFACTALLLSLFGFFFRGYWIYSQEEHGLYGVQPYLDLIHGHGPAPFQYRIGPVRVAYWLNLHLHLPFRAGFSLEDLVGSVFAVMGGYWLLCRSAPYRQASQTLRWFASSAFVALVLYYMAWQDWYKKSDTEPAAGLTVLLLMLWSAPGSGEVVRGGKAACVAGGVLVVTLAESLVRPEIAFWMAAGIFLVALLPGRGLLSLPRAQALVLAALAAATAASVQLLMSHVIYPNAHYLLGIVFMLPYDWKSPQGWVDFLAYLAPALWTLRTVCRWRIAQDAASTGFLFGAVPFVLLWVMVGRIEEVRIFLPVGIALVPLTCQLLLLQVREAENGI
ncbi:MAG: hypothetical protein PW735_00780 [Acidobacteriaceae bacterium]|nr:hypothetical protein [Acidobacteriaceae bacterium]